MFKRQLVGYNTLGYYTETGKWTTLTQECYERGCNCQGCLYSEFNKGNCRAKACVLELVRLHGKPKGVKKSMGRSQHVIQYA